jgi:hypothetical protein
MHIVGTTYLNQIFNAVLFNRYFLAYWKVAKIILVLKPEIPLNELISYRSINLLHIVSIIYEELILKRLQPMAENNTLIFNHQFGFRQRLSALKHTHLIVRRTNEAPENEQ